MQKMDRKNNYYSKNETILKFGKVTPMQRPLQNGHFLPKSKIAKNMEKTALQAHSSCSMQKAPRKDSYYWKNGTILKIGEMATMQRL